jgi:glutamate racemase
VSNKKPIGIFDSGIGGLTVAHAVDERLPKEQLIYFGDTAHLPYGDKSPDAIRQYSERIAEFLLEKGCKAIVIACNTASSYADEHLRSVLDRHIPVVNVIDPVVEYLNNEESQQIGVIGTKGTIQAGIYAQKLQSSKPGVKVSSLATALLAPMIEEGFIDSDVSKTVIGRYLTDERLAGIDSIILACTHYPIIKEEIDAFYEQKVRVIDCATIAGDHVAKVLEQEGLLNEDDEHPPHEFYVSDHSEFFEKTAKRFFSEHIHLEQYPIWSD